MKTKILMLTLGVGLVLTSACTKYPPASERLLEDLAILTQYDVNVDFNQFKTYDIDPTVTKITSKDTTTISNDATKATMDQIDKNMQARGFVKQAYSAAGKPDLRFEIVYFQNTTVYGYYYYDWYYPYYGWGWYYPYYPVYYSSYTTGLADIEMVDMKNKAPNNTLYLRWSAFIRGLLTGSHTTGEVSNAVNQAFTQTPQLKTSAK